MNQNLENILELQSGARASLREAEQRLHGIPDWMRELHDEHDGAKAEIETLKPGRRGAPSERRTAEAAVQDAQEKLKKYQQQINKVSTQREYGALLQEIDTVKGQITSSEEQAFSSLERSEQAAEGAGGAARELPRDRRALRRRDDPLGGREARDRPPGGGPQGAHRRPQEGASRAPRGLPVRAHPGPLSRREPSRAVRLIDRPGRERSSASGTAAPATTACGPRSWSRSATAAAWCSATSCKRILFFEDPRARPDDRRGLPERLARSGSPTRPHPGGLPARRPRPEDVVLLGASKTQPAAGPRRGLAGRPPGLRREPRPGGAGQEPRAASRDRLRDRVAPDRPPPDQQGPRRPGPLPHHPLDRPR